MVSTIHSLFNYSKRTACTLGGAIVVCTSVVSCASFVHNEAPLLQPNNQKETVFAVTASHHLVSFNAGKPEQLLTDLPLGGLQAGEKVLGIDFRVSRGQLFALGSSGRLYRVDTKSGLMQQVGSGTFTAPLAGESFGFDFNPTVDRIRVVSDSGLNMRLHPDTGAVVDADANQAGVQTDGALSYAKGDINEGRKPQVVAAGYTYNKKNEKITTNFAIDAGTASLVTQGSREGVEPVVSPNSGRLFTVGALGVQVEPQVSFDIADVSGAALLTATAQGQRQTQLYLVDLTTGKASRLGMVGKGEKVVGMAIEP